MRPAPFRSAAGLRRRLAQTSAAAALLAAGPGLTQVAPNALPVNPDQSLLVSTSGSTMTVTPVSPRTIINWDSYDIGTAATVQYVNPAGVAIVPTAVLNRVTGTRTSEGPTTITESNIFGTLTSADNISVYLINQAGILFGQDATVSVGSLIASTRDIGDRDFITGTLHFTGSTTPPDPAVLVLSGSRAVIAGSTDPTKFKANAGIVGLIAAKIVTTGTINATDAVALVAANDTTLTLNPGSPLSVTVAEGTAISTPMVLRGALNGGSVLVAAATRNTVTNGLLDIDAAMVATSATASDGGIVLAAGRTAALNPRVVMPTNTATGAPSQNNGALGVLLGGSLTAAGTAGAIDVRAKNGIAAQPSGGAALSADGGVYVRADAARPAVGTAPPVGVALGDVTGRLVSATANGVDISTGAGSVTAGIVTAGSGGASGAGALVISGGGAVDLASLFAGETVTISGTAVTVAGEARSETGPLSVTATAGSITADALRSSGLLQANATGGNLVADSVRSDAGTVRIRAVDVLGRTTAGTRAALNAGQAIDLVATGSVTLGAADARLIDARAGGALSASRLSASAGPATGDGLFASGATLDVGTAEATGSTARLVATGGAGSVTSLNAGVDGVLSASGQATLRGGGIVGRDLLVSGTQVRLGSAGGMGGTQQAGRNAVYLASIGTITGVSNDTGLIVRANATSGGAGSIVVDADTGIDLTGITLTTGDPTGTSPIGSVGVRLATPGASLTLGATDANALLSVDAARTTFSPLTVGGAVTLGDTRLVDSLGLSTPGTIRLAGVAIFGDGEALSVTGTGAATTVTATGTLSASGGVSVLAPGAVSLAAVAGGAGTAAIESTGAGLSAGAVSGGVVAARARNALLLDSVSATGAATLTSVTSGITVNGGTLAGGDLAIDAPGAIGMGAVRSTGDTVVFRSTTTPVFGAITAGAVQARSSLTVSRDAGITFAGVRSDTGAVTLTAANGAVVVTGPTAAATTASFTGRSLTLSAMTAGGNVTLDAAGLIRAGDVQSIGGTVVFRSTATPVTGAAIAGAVSANGDLIVARGPGVSFASATSTNGRVSLTSVGTVTVNGATDARTSVTVAARDASLGNVTARGGSVDLSTSGGALTTGQLLATGSVRATGNTNATIAGATSSGADVAVFASGDLTAGALTAATTVQGGATGSASLGDVTAGTGFVDLAATNGRFAAGTVRAGSFVDLAGSTGLAAVSVQSGDRVRLVSGGGRVDVAGAITARNFVTVDARTGAQLGSVTDTGTGASLLRARGGTLIVTGATSAGGPLNVEGSTGVALGATTSTRGSVSIASADGAVAAPAIDAATSIDVQAQGALTLGSVLARGGSALLLSRAGAVGADAVTVRDALQADAATTFALASATAGTDATLGGRDVALGMVAAGTLAATARGGDLTLNAGDVRGAATLTKTGAGTVSIGRLTAGGPTAITSGGGVRADLLQGGATTVSAAGDVSGRRGGLAATVASLSIDAGGSATVAAVTAAGSVGVTAMGATVLGGAIGAGGDLLASGNSVTLGSGAPLVQAAGGRIGVTSSGGAITGLSGLTLRSDSGGGGGRDVTLRSAGAIGFATGTSVGGGPDRQSAVRLAAGSGAAIALDAVEARTIASPGSATVLTHDGPLSIARAATRDSLAVVLSGAATPLTIGTVAVRGGDLSLDTSGALTIGTITAGVGATTLAGATVAGGAVATRALTATARSGSATFSTIDASAGGIGVTAATDLRLVRATATGAITLTSTAGDVTGPAAVGGFSPVVLASSGAAVTVRADATDGVRGVVLLESVASVGGVDLSGRTITAESLASSGGGVTARTRRDAAGITDARMRIGTVDAAGGIVLATGNAAAASDGTLTLDRATSSGGDIAITTIGGGLAARSGSARTILSAAQGTIALDIGGPAVLGSASGRATTVAGGSLDLLNAEATGGALTLTARNGSLLLGTGSASGAAALSATGDLVATRVTAGRTLTASGNTATIASLSAGGDARVSGTTRVAVTTATTPGTLTLAGGAVSVMGATLGALDASAGVGGFDLRNGTVLGSARVASGGAVTFGTLAAGSTALTAATDVVGNRLNASGAASVAAGRDAALGVVSAGGDAALSASRRLTVDSVATTAMLTLTAATVDVGVAQAGMLSATGGAGGIEIDATTVAGATTLRSDAGVALGTLDAGAVDVRAAGALTADALTVRGGLNVAAAFARITTARVTGGATRIATGTGGLALSDLVATGVVDASTAGVLTAGVLDAGSGLAASGASATIGQAKARGGDIGVTATGGDIRLGSASASGGIGLTSSGAGTVTGPVSAGGAYRIDAASVALGSAGATTRQAGTDVALTARTGAITGQGSTAVAGSRSVTLTANGTGGAITFAPDTAIAAGAGDVALATRGAAALGTVTAAAGAVRLDAADAALTGAVSGRSVTLSNVASGGITRVGDTGVGNESEFGVAATRFDLSNAEVGLIAAPAVTIASGARDVVVGALALAPATGATRFAITANGRVDMLGRFAAAGSPASRTIAIGNEAGATGPRTGTIRVAATPAEGGRLLVDGAALELTADRIGVGFDRDFLDEIGYRAAGLGVEQVTREYVARPTSTLYNASALGAQPYSDLVLVQSGTLGLTYGRYALIQNTGRPGEQRGAVIGTAGGSGANVATVRLSAPGSSSNTFSLFGTIDGINSTAAALLGPDRLFVDPSISQVASRVNGCVIGSGAGCLNTSIAQPTLNLFDTSRAEIVRTADDLSLPFDPLIGTNNESLYLDPAAEQTPPDCEGDTPCPPKP